MLEKFQERLNKSNIHASFFKPVNFIRGFDAGGEGTR